MFSTIRGSLLRPTRPGRWRTSGSRSWRRFRAHSSGSSASRTPGSRSGRTGDRASCRTRMSWHRPPSLQIEGTADADRGRAEQRPRAAPTVRDRLEVDGTGRAAAHAAVQAGQVVKGKVDFAPTTAASAHGSSGGSALLWLCFYKSCSNLKALKTFVILMWKCL